MHWGYKTDAGPAAKNLNIHVKAHRSNKCHPV